MPMMFIENGEEFEARHGGLSFPAMDESGDRVFPTGARRGPQGRMEPPNDPEAKQRAEFYYWQCRVEHQSRLYRNLRKDLKETVEYVNRGAAVLPPDPADFERLKQMAKEVLKSKLERDRRERELPETQWKRDREKELYRRRESVSPMIRALSEMPVI